MAGIGIIGTGWGARVQIPTFREAGLAVTAVAGQRPERTREIAGALAVEPFNDWRELVRSPAVDLVSIVTPPSLHLEMTLAALNAGKHVLCEKPTAIDGTEAAGMLDAARSHPELIALIDHELRFLPSWREALTRFDEIGQVRYAEVRYSSPARGERARAWNWWSDARQGGGIWGAVGSHFVDALRYFGMEIGAVRGLLQTAVGDRPDGDSSRTVTSDDLAAVQLRSRNGVPAFLQFSAVASGPDEPSVMIIHGETGALRFSGEEVFIAARGEAWRPILAPAPGASEGRAGNSPGGAFGTATLYLGQALRRALDDGDRSALVPAATFLDGLAQQRVLDAARRSSAAGGVWIGL